MIGITINGVDIKCDTIEEAKQMITAVTKETSGQSNTKEEPPFLIHGVQSKTSRPYKKRKVRAQIKHWSKGELETVFRNAYTDFAIVQKTYPSLFENHGYRGVRQMVDRIKRKEYLNKGKMSRSSEEVFCKMDMESVPKKRSLLDPISSEDINRVRVGFAPISSLNNSIDRK